MIAKVAVKVEKIFCEECSLALIRFIGHMEGVESIDVEDGRIAIAFDNSKVTGEELWIYDNKYMAKQMGDIRTDDKKILSVIGKLTIFLPHINEEYSQWLLLAAPYTNENYNSSFFVEYLNKFDDPQSSVYLGKIFIKILEHYIPYFREENIQSIVEKLYKHGQKDDADKICNIYGMNSYEFLRDLYEKKNSTN